MATRFEALLAGGHPNSLGRTEEVVALVLTQPALFDELFETYRSEDEVVRLRVSSAMKRIERYRRDLILGHLDRFIDEIGELDQPSAQWTLAQLFARVESEMSGSQKRKALALFKRNLEHNTDWIVLNTTMDTLGAWSRDDEALKGWLLPRLDRLADDPRKSVASRARKLAAALA